MEAIFRLRRSALTVALGVAAVLAGLLVTAASAHHGEPATGEDEPGTLGASTNAGVSTDTELTPVGKPGEQAGWQMIAGSKWRADGDITQMASPNPGEPSPTPYDLDFYGLDFLDREIARQALLEAGVSEETVDQAAGEAAKTNGFAVGAQCKRTDPTQPVPPDQVAGCTRIPVIYRYREDPQRGLLWEESYRADDLTDKGGFVGAVAWLGPGRALAVGGTGTYPRREIEREPDEPDTPEGDAAYAQRDAEEGAGVARAWLYESGTWREITDLPAEMRALHAIDASPRPSDCGPAIATECAIAGGMRQLWHFADGRFIEGFGPELFGGTRLDDPDDAFRFRVRDLRFYGGDESHPTVTSALAVTAGCCSVERLNDRPAWLFLDADGWQARPGGGGMRIRPSDARGLGLDQQLQAADEASEPAAEPTWESRDKAVRAVGQFNPDSYYAVTATRPKVTVPGWHPDRGDPLRSSAIRTAGGPSTRYEPREPPSRFTADCDDEQCAAQQTLVPTQNPNDSVNGTPNSPAPGSTLSTLRLHSADGDTRAYCSATFESGSVSPKDCRHPLVAEPDGVPDWAVGVLLSSGRGVAYATALRSGRSDDRSYLAKPSQCSGKDEEVVPGSGFPGGAAPGGNFGNKGLCTPEGYQKKNASKALFELSSYALNAYRVAGADFAVGDEGTGWAVGDHGAILTRGGSVAAAEASPARSGTRLSSEPIPGAEAWAERRPPVTSEPGTIPALGGTREQLAEPGFHEAQAPGPGRAQEIVMSRDGSEGWALGGGSGVAISVFHYDGARWAPCDPRGVSGLIEPDPACAGLASIERVDAVARVPLENDSDPTNDDDFEAVALSEEGLLRYREGRWARDRTATYTNEDFGAKDKPVTGSDVAFTAPDDGWVVSDRSGGAEVFHFDGKGWLQCWPVPACDDPDGRLAIRLPVGKQGGGVIRLAAAGERVYLISIREAISLAETECLAGSDACPSEPYPVILYHDRGGSWRGGVDTTDDGAYNPTDGGWDPGSYLSGQGGERIVEPPPVEGSRVDPTLDKADAPGGEEKTQYQGRVFSLSVAQDADGTFQGWAFGQFGGQRSESAAAVAMRLEAGRWRQWKVADAADDYLRHPLNQGAGLRVFLDDRDQLTLPSEAGRRNAFLVGIPPYGERPLTAPGAIAFDQERERWQSIPAPRADMIAPDGQGGFWATAMRRQIGGASTNAGADTLTLHHYTDRAPPPLFEESPSPAKDATITAIAGARDGTLWLGDENGALYRYDRLAGWSGQLQIPGWDARVTTNPAGVSAIALRADGSGVAVGPGGRIANLGGDVGLDPAATVGCLGRAPQPPCGTGNDLLAATVAPDGSQIVAGADRTILWRAPGGDFRSVAEPAVPLATAIVRVAMPRPDRAYLLTDRSQLIAGEMGAPGQWSWRLEVGDPSGNGDPLTNVLHPQGARLEPGPSRLNDLAVDASGHGYAVGDDGVALERTGEGEWRRLPSGVAYDLDTVALPAGGGEGALVGAIYGRLLSLVAGRLEVVRHADLFDPIVFDGPSHFVGTALIPGYSAGEVEAWALLRGRGKGRAWTPQALLHYPPTGGDPLLDPDRGLRPLADSPPAAAGELGFAAFGKQDCDGSRFVETESPFSDARDTCPAMEGSNLTNEVVSRRVEEELLVRSRRAGGPALALFTGDAVDMPGDLETAQAKGSIVVPSNQLRTPLDRDLKHRRWVELVPERLAERGLAVLGAIGGQDLARNVESCHYPWDQVFLGGCATYRGAGAEQLGLQQGANLPWRAAVAAMPAPWEAEQAAGDLRLEPLGAGPLSQPGPEAETPGLSTPPAEVESEIVGAGARVPSYRLRGGRTHYATDVYRGSERVARVVVVDTSLRSLAASDPFQEPSEAGGQLRWLEEMLCFEGSAEDTDGDVRDCTREPGQQAIVLSNTPTYSYGPISPEELQTDAAVFESVLIANEADVVVSGRVGWNGRYWALAPGVHAPCPGEPYRPDSEAPSIGQAEVCGAGVGEEINPSQAIDQLPPEAQQAAGLASRGALPFVVSSTAGGRFNTRAERSGFASAESGFWRGYSIVRLDPSGDPAETVVEQRPILDWVGLSTSDPVVEPRRTLKLQSFAREAFGSDTAPRYYEIPETQAITHRYDLLAADPERPWLPRLDPGAELPVSAGPSTTAETSASDTAAPGSAPSLPEDDPCGPYVCLPERVGTTDPTTGEVSAGNGKYPDTFAMATLSVGDHVAAQPLVFTKSPSFIVGSAVAQPSLPSPPTSTGTVPAPPAPPNPPTPNVPQASVPNPPPVPPIAPLQAAEPPEPQPPAPPAPPPPSEAPAPLNLTLAPPSITVATPTAVIQPPTPPVNPAPPGGARREARQRQAAAQKSGADSDEQATDNAGDLAEAPLPPHGSAMTRRDRVKAEPSFTAIARADQPSAWAQGALYAGGMTLLAAALALGWQGVRPTPRRRPPEVPSPAWARISSRRP